MSTNTEPVRVRAKRGRKPKPVVEATFPAPDGTPVKPSIVACNAVASRLWDEIVPTLVEAKIIGRTDVMALAALCIAWSRLVRARGILGRARSWIVQSDGGAMKAHPMIAVEQSACRDVMAAVDKLGLSPTARARITFLSSEKPRSLLDPELLDFAEDTDLEDILSS